jgi:hypothetical protein
MDRDEDAIVFDTDHLLTKWGFADGLLLEHFLLENGFGHMDQETDEWYEFSRRVLCEVVERFVLPEIENDIKPYRVSSSHNPIRLYEVDGCHMSDIVDSSILRPREVQVSKSTVLETATLLYQKRFDEEGKIRSYLSRSAEATMLFKTRSWL